MKILEIEKANEKNNLVRIFANDKDIVSIGWCRGGLDIYEPELRDDNIVIASNVSLSTYDFIQPENSSNIYRNRKNIYTLFKRYGIYTPKTIAFRGTSIINIIDDLEKEDMLESKKFVFRSLITARSIGNIVIENKQMESFLEYMKIVACTFKGCDKKPATKEEASKILDMSKDYGISMPSLLERGYYLDNDEMYRLESILKNNEITVIQEVLDIKKEYRFYYHFGMETPMELFCIKRSGYSLNPNKNQMKDEYALIAIDGKLKKLLEKVIYMLKELKIMTASIDVFIDNNDNVGCFEFSTEYSFDGMGISPVYKFKKSLKEAILNFKRENNE